MKHLFLILFFLTFTLNLVLSGLLFMLESIIKVSYYRKLAAGFLWAGFFMLFWYLSSYIVLNIYHQETIPYTIIEALAFISSGVSIYFFLSGVLLITQKTTGKRSPILVFSLIGAGILGFTKCASFIFKIHYAFIHWLKLCTALGLILLVVLFSFRLFIRKKADGAHARYYAFPKSLRLLIGLAGVILPSAGVVDFLIIRDKFYEGQVRLSMNFPVFITGYFIFSILLIIVLVSRIRLIRNPEDQLKTLVEIYNITPREFEIMEMIVKGKSNQEIAKALYISLSTVKNHIHHIFQKLGVTSRFELINHILAEK